MMADHFLVPEICIGEMSANDVPEVAALERLVFSEPWSEEGFLSELKQPHALYLTARVEETSLLAGYCGLLQSLHEADIVNVAVREEFRGRGIAQTMLEKLMELGRERGVKRFTLEVRKSNRAALRLYEKLGFHQAGVRTDFYEKPVEDALILWT